MKLISKFINEDEYLKILNSSKSVSLFHSLEWLSLIKKSMDLKIIYIATFNQRKDIISVMPLCIKKFFFELNGRIQNLPNL